MPDLVPNDGIPGAGFFAVHPDALAGVENEDAFDPEVVCFPFSNDLEKKADNNPRIHNLMKMIS